MEGQLRRAHHQPAGNVWAAPAIGAGERFLPGRRPVPRGARSLRAPLRKRTDLPGRLHRQLVPALPDGALRPRSGARTHRRPPLLCRYPLAEGEGSVTVATTRPETMLGDTAVAVNPADERYRKYHGATLSLPVLGRPSRSSPMPTCLGLRHRRCEDHPGPRFQRLRSGPAPRSRYPGHRRSRSHDLRKGLAGKYQGLDRFDCRDQILKDLKADGLLVKMEPYTVPVGHCYRCKTIVGTP